MGSPNVLFLDIDGVLNSEAWFAQQRGRGLSIISNRAELIDPVAVGYLNRIVAATGCRVVLSSSWRLHASLSDVRGWLEGAGYMGPLNDRTPRLGSSRGAQVAAWLGAKGASAYVILDDEPEANSHPGRWVVTRYAEGLTAREADEATRLLGVAHAR